MDNLDKKVKSILDKLGFKIDKIYLDSSMYQYGYATTINNFYYVLIYNDFNKKFSFRKILIKELPQEKFNIVVDNDVNKILNILHTEFKHTLRKINLNLINNVKN